MTTLTIILLLLTLKHFIADALLQKPYQYLNKGMYGHPGGIVHAGIHGIGTILCFLPFGFGLLTCLALGVTDALIHYHIDWGKMNFGSARYSKITFDHAGKKALCIYDDKFFYWLIADQCLHFATYILLVSAPVLNLT